MNKIDRVYRFQLKQWLAALAASLAFINVGNETFWILRTLKNVVNSNSASGNDKYYVWDGFLVIATCSSVIGAILGAVLAEKFGRKKTLLVTSFFTISQIASSFTTNCVLSYVTLVLGEIGLGITRVVVPLYISEIVDDDIRGAVLMLQMPFFYIGRLIGVGIGYLISAEVVGVVSSILTGIFLFTFTWFPETPYYLASKKRPSAATKSLAFYRDNDTLATEEGIEVVMRNDSQGCSGKIQELMQLTNRKGLVIIMFFIIVKWSEQILDTRSNLVHVAMGTLVSSVYHAEIIANVTSLITSFLILFTIDVIGRRSFLSYSTFSGFILMIISLVFIVNGSHGYQWVHDVIGIALHFCHVIFVSVPLVYVGELFSSNVKALAIAIVITFDMLARFVIVALPEALVMNSRSLDVNRSYIGGMILLVAFPITFAFTPETKRKSFSDIQSKLARTLHCEWLIKKLIRTERSK